MGRGRKNKPDTLAHAIQRLEIVRAQRDELLVALQRVLERFDPYAIPGVEENEASVKASEAAISKVTNQKHQAS